MRAGGENRARASWQHRVLHWLLLRFASRLNRRQPDLRQRRARLDAIAGRRFLPHGTSLQPAGLPGMASMWLTSRRAAPRCTLLYLHGGGYVMGSLNSHRFIAAYLAKIVRARVLLIDYRLAPEHPFPAALQDALAAYDWLAASQRHSSPSPLFLAGDSAGGGLALAALLALRDAGRPLPAGAICLSPWTDLACTGETIRSRADADPIAPAKFASLAADLYLQGADPRTPAASPLYASLHGLPPLLIQVGTNEILLADSLRFAEKAQQAGVRVRLEIWPEMMHVWQAFAPFVPESVAAFRHISEWVTEIIAAGARAKRAAAGRQEHKKRARD